MRKEKQLKDEQEKKLVNSVIEDFKQRASKRKNFDLIWQINMNFLMGNQFCNVGYGGELEESQRQFFWQEREVFNHIAPIYDMRYAKLSKIRPDINIIPSTNDDKDKHTAKLSKKIYKSIKNALNIDSIMNQAIKWSEVCGTVFYKVGWNSSKGQVVGIDENGNKLRSGEVEISVVSPFEIYPDSAVCETVDDCQSLIHAKAYTVSQIRSMYGVEVEGSTINTYSLDNVSEGLGGLGFNATASKMIETEKNDCAIVIEKYEKPTAEYPDGRLIIVAGDKLVYNGALPYFYSKGDDRYFPFVKQTSIEEPGSFWGTSVIERLIPVQRAYNAVKNRKHEFINRLSLGVLSVEDGSVDLDNLEDDGLCPGKILVYRQGSSKPQYLEAETLPNGLDDEEKSLIDEFNKISGVSDLLSSSSISSNISGIALELMISEDEVRLNASIESIKNASIEIAKMILNLYKQFAIFPRLAKISGDKGEIEMFYFSSSDISSDDITLENVNDGFTSLSQRRDMIFALLENGILNNEKGELSNRMKSKILDMLGMGIWDNSQDICDLQLKKADKENLKMFDGVVCKVSEIDDNEIHIAQHTAFMLSEDFDKAIIKNPALEKIFLEHIKNHKLKLEEK